MALPGQFFFRHPGHRHHHIGKIVASLILSVGLLFQFHTSSQVVTKTTVPWNNFHQKVEAALEFSSSSSNNNNNQDETTVALQHQVDPDDAPRLEMPVTEDLSVLAQAMTHSNQHSLKTTNSLSSNAITSLESSKAHNQATMATPGRFQTLTEKYFPKDPGPYYLVVCRDLDRYYDVFPMLANWTIVELERTKSASSFVSSLPPWNATAILVVSEMSSSCQKHPYVVEALRRREQAAPIIPLHNHQNASSSTTIHKHNGYHHGVHWPTEEGALRKVHNRPVLMRFLGEVFWRGAYKTGSCAMVDFQVYREIETRVGKDCWTIHFLQAVATSYMRNQDEFPFVRQTNILEGRIAHPHKPANMSSMRSFYSKGFCSIMLRYDPTDPVNMFRSTNKDVDAIVRESFFRRLNQYRNCTRVVDDKGPYNAFHAMVGYKFHITMDNTQLDGYMSEKLFNGALGGGIPIYFGSPNYAEYGINPRALVDCNIPSQAMKDMRSFYFRKGRNKVWKFSEMANRTAGPTNAELIAWADAYLHPFFESCVQEIISLDQNNTAFWEMIQEPFLVHDQIMSGEYPLQGFAAAYNFLRHGGGGEAGLSRG